MNNSKIAFDNLDESSEDRSDSTQKQIGEVTQIIEAINRVEASDDWQKLKGLVLDGVVATLEKRIQRETEKKELDLPELYRLQGQLTWAKKYANLKKLSDAFRVQLEGLKKLNHEQPSHGGL